MRLTAQLAQYSDVRLRVKYLIEAARFGLKAGAGEGALLIEGEAKTLVPVKTGNLQNAIHTEHVVDEPTKQVFNVTPAVPADNPWGLEPAYARRIEFGFEGVDSLGREYHQAAQPYMRPAGDSQGPEALKVIGESIRSELISASSSVGSRRHR